MPSAVVDRIDRYEILAELGRGATGVVYKARDPELDRLVAIKTLRPARDLPAEQCGELQRRLRSEAATVARLSHPHIVAIHDVVIGHDIPCIVMEHVEGSTLARLISEAPLEPARAIEIVLQICDALEYAHALGVVHGDIKPGNILVSATGLAKLGDFSTAQLSGQAGTGTGAMVGTPGYMAPEQVTDGAMDTRSDLFSLGVVLYEAVAGVRAFPGSDLAAVLHDIAHVEPASPRRYNAAVTPALTAIIRQAMCKQSGQRYASARAFAQALAQARDSTGAGSYASAVRTARRALTVALAGLAIAGSSGGPSEARRSAGPPTGPSAAPVTTNKASVRLKPAERSEVRRPVEATTGGADRSAAVPRPERTGQRHVHIGAHQVGPAAKRAEDAETLPRGSEAPRTAGAPRRHGCLSVNAVPFATVLVDGQLAGETPAACLRVEVGEHRVQLQQDGDRSPERVVRVGEQHTVEHPVRLSYDFRSGRFGDGGQ